MADTPSQPPGKPAAPAAPAPAGKLVSASAAPAPAATVPAGTVMPVSAEAADEAARKEVLKNLRGPVAGIFKTLMPELANEADPYKAILGHSELLERAFKTFAEKRASFATFLVDPKAQPVSDDAVRLSCGRSVVEVTAMAVRSGMRAYAEQHFGDSAKPAPLKSAPKSAAENQRAGWIAAIAAMFHARNPKAGAAPAKGSAAKFYPAIRNALDFAWQVPFFPVYVEIPPELFEKLGTGITRIDSLEKLQRLAKLANDDIAKAEAIMGNPELAKEMLENNALAAESVSQMTAAEFKTVHDALAHLDVKQKWDVFGNKLTALMLGQDKRISKADIVALADHLHILNEYAVRIIFDLQLGRDQFAHFLETAGKALGRSLFLGLFGPIPFFGTDEAATQKRKSYTGFVESTLKSLVAAVQQLKQKFKQDAPEVLSECLTLVCEARREGIAAEMLKLAPAPG